MLGLPILRSLVGNALLAHQKSLFLGCLARALQAGGAASPNVDLMADRLGSPPVRADMLRISRGLNDGLSFTEAAGRCEYLSSQEKGIIAAGEVAGELPRVLDDIAGYLRDDLEHWLIVTSRTLPMLLLLMSALFVVVQLW